MMNSYAEAGGGFNSNHGQASRPAETQKQQNINPTWSYNSQLESMYYGGEHQPMFVGPYEGTTKHANYPQYPSGTLHQPVPTPVVKCNEACCQHFQDRFPLNPAPLRYQPSGPVQPRYTELPNPDTRQYFTDRRTMPSMSRKKVYADNGYPSMPDRRFPQYVGRGQLHLDSRQQMQMMRAQYPVYPPYWGTARGWAGPRMNCPPPPSYHQSINQGAQLKMTDGSHYIDPSAQKSFSTQHRRAVGTSGGTDLIRPIPDPKRTALDPNSQNCYEFGYPTGFVPFSEVNKIQGGSLTSQNSSASCKIPSEKQYHPHQMQYAMQSGDRSLLNCGNPINDLNYSMNFSLPGNDSYMRSALEDGQSASDSRKLQYDSLSKKRPDLDLRQYLATWEDDEDESTRIPEAIALGNNGAPYIVVDCRSLEGEAAAKLQERFKTTQSTTSKSRSGSPVIEQKQSDDQSRRSENNDRTGGTSDFQNQNSFAPSMPTLLNESDKSLWNSLNREDEGVIGKGAFQPLDCSKRDSNQDSKRDSHPHGDLPVQKMPGTNENSNMTLDALVSYYGDNRRIVDGGYDFVEMTERLVNNTDKTPLNNRSHMDHSLPSEISRPCDPRLQQSQLGNNPSIYNKVPSRYPTTNYQHYKPGMHTDPYYNYKHPVNPSKYIGYDNSQVVDPNYEYHKIAAEFDNSRFYGSKDVSKDPRRVFHQEIEKSIDSAFYDPIRKPQLADCFQDKANLEFASVDPDQFINPVAIKKSLDPREKLYSDKNPVIRERIDNATENQSEKMVVITSQNGPPEVFRVPFSPDKDISNKDNVVTLHAGDQNKSSTMTVEVPYVQQYSTLVKLSEEISRAEKDEVQCTKGSGSIPSKKSGGEEFKKPTSFKLKRVPNSKEWTVEGKERVGSEPTTDIAECENSTLTSSSCEMEARDLKQSGAVSSLNMPILDDIRDGDENQNVTEEQQSNGKPNDGVLSSTTLCSDDINKSKYNVPTPQMAIVQPMKMGPTNSEPSIATCENSNKVLDDSSDKAAGKGESKLANSEEVELSTDKDISKHGNFRAHKKIQSGFSNALSNCIVSSNDDFLHSQDLNTSESKETYSPFPVFPDCDVNSQLSDYFKIDERNAGEKILNNSSRVPTSPGVDAMFEDINNSDQNQLYPTKSCNFHDLTDPNVALNNHNAHFQSFSSIFSDESDKVGRPDGSVLQMNEKKYLKNIFGDISHHEREDKLLESSILNEVGSAKSDENKKSPPIPTISLKLNETKKMWCIANKDDSSVSDDSNERLAEVSPKSMGGHCQVDLSADAVSGLENDLAQALQKESTSSLSKKYSTLEVPSALLDLNENEQNSCCESQNESDLNKLICEEIDKHNSDSLSNILELDYRRNYSLALEETSHFEKENLNHLQNANKCRSLVKYCPRNKVNNKTSFKCTDRYKTLIFDENGKDFTHQSYLEACDADDAHSFVQDLLLNVISKTVDICEQKNKVPCALFDFDEPENVKMNDEYAYDGNVSSHTVIKFDNSGYHNTQGCILTTTTNFIQHERETSDHSVIKAVQSEDSKEKKMTRSIFSPQSEDGDPEDTVNNNDIACSTATNKEDLCSGICKGINKQALDLTYKRKHTDNTTFGNLNMNKINKISTSVILDNVINEEGSKEFCSSHAVIPNNSRDNLEIDEALELMGLATSKPIDIESKNEENVEASLSEEKADKRLELLHSSLESNDGLHCTSIETRANSKMQIDSKESKACPETVYDEQVTTTYKLSDGAFTHERGELPETSEPLKDKEIISARTAKIDHSCLSESDDTYQYNTGPLNLSELSLPASVAVEKVDLTISTSSESLDMDFTTQIQTDFTQVSKSGSDGFSPQEHVKRKCNGENGTKEMFPKKAIKASNVKSKKRYCNNWVSSNAHTEHLYEDVESRLEMSVIVRNKSCSSRACNSENSYVSINDINREKNETGVELQSHVSPEDLWNHIKTGNSTIVHQESNDGHLAQCPPSLSPPSHSGITNTSMYLDSHADSKNTVENDIKTVEHEDTDLNCLSFNKNKPEANPPSKSMSSITINYKKSAESPYCTGESIFLCNDEANSYLKVSRLSYFYEFKRRKWQRYCESSLAIKDDYSGSTNKNTTSFNHSCVENLQSAEETNDPESRDTIQEGPLMNVPNNVPLTNINDNNCVKLVGEHNLPNLETQETFQPNAPNVSSHGKQSFCVRRDSLKILEPEAVLKEIFSPDPSPYDSESKENTCPTDGQLQNKQIIDTETSPLTYLNQTSIIQYNSKVATMENKFKDASSVGSSCILKNQVVALNAEPSDLGNNCTFLAPTFNDDTPDNIAQDRTRSVKSPTESKERHKTVIYCRPDSNHGTFECSSPTQGVIKDLHVSSHTPVQTKQLKSLESPNFSDSLQSQQLPFKVSGVLPSHDLHENTNVEMPTCKNFNEASGHDKHITSYEKYTNSKTDGENKVKNVKINIRRNSVEKLDRVEIESSLEDASCPQHPDDNSRDFFSINSGVLSESSCNSVDVEKQDSSSSDFVASNPDKNSKTQGPNQPKNLDHCPTSNCGNFNLSNDSHLTSDKNEGLRRLNGLTVSDESSQDMCNQSERNVAIINQMHLNENKALSSGDNKDSDEGNILNINSVQDSFIHNHHLNKENPLQCLVEAALALENVESHIINNKLDRVTKIETFGDCKNYPKPINEDRCLEENVLTPADKEIFSKFEETNYNLRASTRIVTSSSSNIIPYPKRKYTFKSSKFSSRKSENKTKVSDQPEVEKCRSKKRKCGFSYPRSKRRKKVTKNKTAYKLGCQERFGDGSAYTLASECENPKCEAISVSENLMNKTDVVEKVNNEDHYVLPLQKPEDFNSRPVENITKEDHFVASLQKPEDMSSKSCATSSSVSDFGGPLITANNHNSNEGSVLCVHVSSGKTDECANNISLGDFGVMTENQSIFKESSVGVDSIPDETLENNSSLVIIFENLEHDNSDKLHSDEGKKEESDIILGSMDKTSSVLCLPQSDSTLDDSSELLTTEVSVNESCICPPELDMKVNPDRAALKSKQPKLLDCDTLIQPTYNIADKYCKLSTPSSQEILAASCYEELNENLVNDIGNWPFVEEEVAEFNDKRELPNEIPEEGRKIELKCSLPWKKIFNISRKKKNKETKKVSGLELGPAKVEVRLRAPSSEWKVISDLYDNASPVVKVKRLILQRDSDLSSFSEKDSEEENEQKRKAESNNFIDSPSPLEPDPIDGNMKVTNEVLTNVIVDEHWQPVVLLKRIENFEEVNLTLEREISQGPTSPCSSSQSSFSPDGKSVPGDSISENEAGDDVSLYSHHSGGSEAASEQSEIDPMMNKMKDIEKDYFSDSETPAKAQAYETYSPSNCNNTFTGEKLYSPSDPHFSPGSRCKDSENDSSSEYTNYHDFSSDGEEQCVKHTSSGSVIDTVEQVQKEALIMNVLDLDQEHEPLVESNNYNQEEATEVTEDLHKEDSYVKRPNREEELDKITSDTTNICESPKITATENCLPSSSVTLVESNSPHNNVTESLTALGTARASTSQVNYESPNEVLEVSLDAKQNVKRKMPKNFFVRRRLKKRMSYNESSGLDEGKTESSVRPFTFSPACDSISHPLVLVNQRHPTSSQTSTSSKNETITGNNDHQSTQSNSESDVSFLDERSRLQSVYNLEVSSKKHNESPLIERFEVKQRLRDGGRGLKRPSEGHSKGDTKRRRRKFKNSNRCQECNIQFEKKEELARHNAYRHTRRRELHHCLLCQRSFSSAVRHSLHVQGRSHRHLELVQRHTMHAMHHLLVGGEFPLIPPLSRAELRALQWRPAQPGYSHYYHQLTPLQAALQEHNTDVSEDTLSEDRMPND